jgi:hypothetical protein
VSAAAEAVAAEAELAPGEEAPRRPRRRRAPKPADEGPAPAALEAQPEIKRPRRRGKAGQPVVPAVGETQSVLSAQEEQRIRGALGLRDRALDLVARLDQQGLADYSAIVDRLTLDYDLRSVTAALLRELAGREGRAITAIAPSPAKEAAGEEDEQNASDEAMTRLFISIGRRARISKDGLQKLIRETAGIDEEDIGRIDLLHNFAFIEVRKAVASLVIEKMHESMFKGREIMVERAKSAVRDEEQPEPAES